VVIKIAGNDIIFEKNSWSMDDTIGARSSTQFTAISKVLSTVYAKGQPVEVYEGADLLFSGYIEKVSRRIITGVSYFPITAVDNCYLADKRVIAASYQNETAGNIVTDIFNTYLDDEGVTIGTVQTGTTIQEAVFNYVRVSDALDSLAEKAGFWWNIDKNKELHFVARETYTAPFQVSEKDMEKGSVSVEKGNQHYRNKQYIKGGKDITDPQTEHFKGDGVNQTFSVGYPIAKVPTIKLNNVSQSVGIRGLDENKDWYWAKGSNAITQEREDTPKISTDDLAITYQGEFDIVVVTYDQAAISDRQNVEGTTGIIEVVDDEPSASGRATAFQTANSKLRKYCTLGRTIKFRTWKAGLAAGQILTVNRSDYGLDGVEMLIETINVSKKESTIWYDVTATENGTSDTWAKFFYKIASKQIYAVRENIGEDEVLTILEQFSKTWAISDNPNMFKEVYASASLYPSTSLYPMIAYADRVKRVKLLNASNAVLLNKAITTVNGEETGEVLSTLYVSPNEANGSIAKVSWYGGKFENILMDQQVYVHSKTELESIQIDKTDTRNFTPASGTFEIDEAYMTYLDNLVDSYLSHTA